MSAPIDEQTAPPVERNIALAFAFAQAVLADPVLRDRIPDGATVVLLPEDDPALARFNLDLGVRKVLAGEDVYFHHVHARPATRRVVETSQAEQR